MPHPNVKSDRKYVCHDQAPPPKDPRLRFDKSVSDNDVQVRSECVERLEKKSADTLTSKTFSEKFVSSADKTSKHSKIRNGNAPQETIHPKKPSPEPANLKHDI